MLRWPLGGCVVFLTLWVAPLAAAVPGSFTLSNQAPVCDTTPPAGPAVRLNWTPSSGVTTYDVYRNGVLYSPGVPSGTLTFNNNANLTAGQTYTYFVRARNASGTTDSNTISVPISSTICASVPGSFTLSNQAPVCNTTPPAGPAVQLNWTPSSGVTTYDVYRNGALYSPGVPSGTLTFNNNANLTAGQTYTYFVRARNASGTTDSNTISVPISSTICASVPGSFTLSNQAPVCNTTPPAGPAVQLNWTPSSGVTTYDVYRNGVLYSPGVPSGTLTFNNNANLTAGQTYTYFVRARNASGTTDSNTISVPISSSICGSVPSFTLYSTSPSSPAAGQQFTINISGNNFDSSTAQILFTGPGCSPCTVPNAALSTKNATLLIGPVTLNTVGNYTVSVQNGPGGAISEGKSLTIGGVTPSLGNLSTNPSPPVVGQPFTLTINGSGFDPNTAQILIFGTNCGPCTVTNGALTTKSAAQIAGPVTLSSGSFNITVQNGSGGGQSNSLSLTVGAALPSFNLYTTSPSSPAAGQQFTINISGNNFDSSTAQILFTGPGCSPCTVPNGTLSTKNATLLIGPVTLNTVGNYTVSVQNGPGGAISNGKILTIGGATPSLSNLSTNPNPPVVGQPFTLTINGSSFDPNTAQILIFGTNCGPCTVTNGALTTKTASQIAGPVTLTSGSFNIAVQNGSGGGQSTSLSLTVGATTPEPNWTQKSPANSPPPRGSHAMAFDAARGQVVLFGGWGPVNSVRNDTWVWDGTNWTQKSPANSPTARIYHAMAYDAARGQVVLFGGDVFPGPLSDTWVWDGTNWTQKSPANSPTNRWKPAMAYDAARGQVVLFGGGYSGGLNDTWVWDGTNWTQKSPTNSPPPLWNSAMAYDAARGQMVLFGGQIGGSFRNDTWVWDGTNWTQKSPVNSPPPRGYHAMAYDTARGQVVLNGGGDDSGIRNDTWVWDGTNWTQKNPANNPPPQYRSAMAYDTAHGQVVLFGGAYGNSGNDTWVWASGSTPTTGSISVTTNLPTAAFTITGPANYTGGGTSFTAPNTPAGTYTIIYNAVTGYSTPLSETKTLTAGGTIVFSGSYAATGNADPGATSKLRLVSGTINGQAVSPSSRTVTVAPGVSLSGSFVVQVDSTFASNAVMAMGLTPTWGAHATSYTNLGGFATPVAGLQKTVNVNLPAPATAGTYYLITAFRNESNAGQLMSATNPSAGSLVWDNGDDIADWSPITIGVANSYGTVQAKHLFADGHHVLYFPSTALKIVVTPAVPTLTVKPSSLEFQYQQGVVGVVPSKALSVDVGVVGTSVSASATTSSGGNWLTLDTSTVTAPGSFYLSVAASRQSTGSYSGQVTLSGTGMAPIIVPVTLIVTADPQPPGVSPPKACLAIGTFIKTLPTIVLTHGLQKHEDGEFSKLWTGDAALLIQDELASLGTPANIIQYIWEDAFQVYAGGFLENNLPDIGSYKAAQEKAENAGNRLAAQLIERLGTDYAQPIHFIGHSLGTIVNTYAASAFLPKVPNVKYAQFTALDRPQHISKLNHASPDDERTPASFGEDFFAHNLLQDGKPRGRRDLSLQIDNYYGAGSLYSVSAVGDTAHGPIYNRKLIDPGFVGSQVFGEIIGYNDHSGVQQWYRWTILPNDPFPYNPLTGGTTNVCHAADWINLHFLDSSLTPCKYGWKIALGDHLDNPATFANNFPASNGGAVADTIGTDASINTVAPNGCSQVTPTTYRCAKSPSFATALSDKAPSLRSAGTADTPFVAMTINLPQNPQYLSFKYQLGSVGSGDYISVVLDNTPIWVLSGTSAPAGELQESGLIPISGFAAGPHQLRVTLHGVGPSAFSFDVSEFRVDAAVVTDPTVQIVLSTSPAGQSLTVDGATLTAPQTVNWIAGSAHSVSVASPQAGSGARYVFANWSDGGAQSRTITTPATATSYTANFTIQFLLTTNVNPAGAGTLAANPSSLDGYYNSGAAIQMTATPSSGKTFAFFSGDLAGSTNPQSVTMTAPRSVTANFFSGIGGNVPPYGLELSPFQGAGVTRTFTGTFNDANGWADIAKATFRFHESYAGTVGACIVEMRPQTGQITLLDDAGVSYLAPVALGSATPLQNNACSVDALNSTFTGSGNVLTANVALTFKPAFGSAGGREPRKAVCQWAKDTAGAGEDQSCFGMWLPEAPAPVKIPRYRLYNPANFAHFFTASQNERDVLVTRGFTPEDPPPGMAYNQPATISGISTHPFYRILFFPQNGAPIFHYWTRDREEYKTAVRNRTLNLGEGMDSFLLSGQAPGTYPTYRMRFTAGPTAYPIYHYALQAEHDALLGFGWGVSLGVDGYLQPMPAPLAQVTAGLQTPPRKVIAAVLSAASHESGAVAPGQLIRVYGSNFSKFARAFVDDSAVQLTTVTERYIELAVPETVAGRESIALFVDDLGVRTEAVTVPITPANPAVFVKDFLGRGIVETLPSEAGTITLQLTGAGELDLGQPKLSLTVRLNGYPADIISISAIADQPGRLAVNVKLPAELLAAGTDLATVSLQAGEANAQPGLLVRVK